jgi:hypothetical protein
VSFPFTLSDDFSEVITISDSPGMHTSILPEKTLMDSAVTDWITDLAPSRMSIDLFFSSVRDFSPVQSKQSSGRVEFSSKLDIAFDPT